MFEKTEDGNIMVPLSYFSTKYGNKEEVQNFIRHKMKAYIPDGDQVSWRYYRGLLSGEMNYIKQKDIKQFTLPQTITFQVKSLWQYV